MMIFRAVHNVLDTRREPLLYFPYFRADAQSAFHENVVAVFVDRKCSGHKAAGRP